MCLICSSDTVVVGIAVVNERPPAMKPGTIQCLTLLRCVII